MKIHHLFSNIGDRDLDWDGEELSKRFLHLRFHFLVELMESGHTKEKTSILTIWLDVNSRRDSLRLNLNAFASLLLF